MVILSCRITGITGTIDIPAVEGKKAVLHYTHPLAHIDSLLEINEEGIRYLRSLDIEILAGMFLSTIRYLDAFTSKEDSLFLNKQLQTAGKGALMHCTKALLDYVVPAHKFNRKAKAGLLSVRLEKPFESAYDARQWLQSVMTNIMEEHLNYEDMADYARSLVKANEKKRFLSPSALRTQCALIEAAEQARLDAQARIASDAQAKAEKLRKAKKERLASSMSGSRYSKADLYYCEDADSCVVEAHIANDTIPRQTIHNKLVSTFERERAEAAKYLPTKASARMLSISKTLSYMPTDKLKALLEAIKRSENYKAMQHMARVVELLVAVDAEAYAITTLFEDLDNTVIKESETTQQVETKPSGKMTLRERIAARKGEKA